MHLKFFVQIGRTKKNGYNGRTKKEKEECILLLLKFVLAMLPIIWLIAALSGLKMPGHKACLIALVITIVLALGYWKLSLICVMTAAL